MVAEIAFLSKTSPNVSAYAISVTLGGTISAPLPEMDLLSDVIGRQQYRGRAYLSLLYLQSICSRESAGLFAHTRTRLSLVCIENDTRYRNTEGGSHRWIISTRLARSGQIVDELRKECMNARCLRFCARETSKKILRECYLSDCYCLINRLWIIRRLW